MRYYCWLSVLSFLAAGHIADFVTPPIPWHDMRAKHTWRAVPANWESLGHLPASTTIDHSTQARPQERLDGRTL